MQVLSLKADIPTWIKCCDYNKLGLKEIDSYIEGTNLYLW